MTARAKQEQSVVTNLEDAGCDIGLIEQFMDLMKTGKKEAGLRFPLTSWNPSSRTICNYTRQRKTRNLSTNLCDFQYKTQQEEFMMNTMPKIVLGAWSWGAGAGGAVRQV